MPSSHNYIKITYTKTLYIDCHLCVGVHVCVCERKQESESESVCDRRKKRQNHPEYFSCATIFINNILSEI